MPGTCFCKSGIHPLSAFKFPPQLFDNLLWLAKQSAFVVSSTRPRVSNFFSGLRLLAMKNGYIEGCRETSIALAKTIEERYGHDFLNYIDVKTFEHEEPAQWIRKFLLQVQVG